MSLDTQKLTCVGLAAALMASNSAFARSADLRLGVDSGARFGHAAKVPATILRSIRTTLTPFDRNALDRVRSRSREASLGPFDLALSATRLNGTYSEIASTEKDNRLRAATASLGVGLDSGGDVSLRSELLLTHVKYHPGTLLSGDRARAMDFETMGLGLERRGGSTLMLDYVRASAPGKRAPVERMVEIAEGLPRAGRGMRLTYSATPRIMVRNGIQWGFAVSAWRRPASEFGISSISRSVAESRAELFFRVPL